MRWKLQLTAPTDGMQSLGGRSKWGAQVGGGSRRSRSVLDGLSWDIWGDGEFAVVLVGGARSGRGRTQSRAAQTDLFPSQPPITIDKRQKLGSLRLSWGCVAAGSWGLALNLSLCLSNQHQTLVMADLLGVSSRYQLQVNAVSGLCEFTTAINHIFSAYPPKVGDASGRIRFVTVDQPEVDKKIRKGPPELVEADAGDGPYLYLWRVCLFTGCGHRGINMKFIKA